MTWRYAFGRKGETPVAKTVTAEEQGHTLREPDQLITGAKQVYERVGDLTTIEQDLLTLAAAILAADRASQRGEREAYNRRLTLQVSLHNVDRFYPQISALIRILRLLTQDAWKIELTQTKVPAAWGTANHGKTLGDRGAGAVLLFSGGLDSLGAAVEFGAKGPLLLVSHITRNQVTDNAQVELVKLLKKKKLVTNHIQIFVSSKADDASGLDHDAEPSQRTRSIVFMVLGAILARREGFDRLLYMAENGQMAIHLPLSAGRIGAFSTHTAHPAVLKKMERFLSEVLDFDLRIVNPYVYMTKAEVVSRVVKGLPAAIPISTSCWRNARVSKFGATHCGECVPCLIRRIAVENNGTDKTAYRRDLFAENVLSLPPDDEGRRNLADITELVARFNKSSDNELVDAFPDLISTAFDMKQVIGMYRRFGAEARAVLGGYTQLQPLLA